MTVEQFINARMPNVSFDDFQKLCASVGIVITSNTDKLTNDTIARLVNNHNFNDRLANGTIIISLKELTGRLQKIRNKYDEILASANVLPEDIKDIQEARARIEDSISKYNEELDTVITRDSYAWRSIFEKAGKKTSIINNPVSQARFNSLHTRTKKKSKKLTELYSRLDTLDSEEVKTAFKKIKRKREREKVVKKIESLRKRQGVLMAKQRKVSDKFAKKYISAKSKVETKEVEIHNKELEYLKRLSELLKAMSDYKSDIEASEKELDKLEKDSSAKKSSLKSLRSEIKEMQKKLDQLHKKSGKLRGQHEKYLHKSEKSVKLS